MINCPKCGKKLEDGICEYCGFKVKNNKHKKIEKMAWELLRGCSERELIMCMLDDKDNTDINTEIIRGCWKIAEEFYKFAKEMKGKIE